MAWCNQNAMDDFDDDYLDWSDDENFVCHSKFVVSSSSDEDIGQYMERIRSKKLVKKAVKPDAKDDFEKEMASELSVTMQKLTASICDTSSSTATTSLSKTADKADEVKPSEKPAEFYDDIYFDSDDSEGEMQHKTPASNKSGDPVRKRDKHRILSNDELFYDPEMDDRDQAWMDKMRRSYQVHSDKRSGAKGTKKPLPESDAVLNCPACLTMLCMDCQRHEIYHNQYRAMFVFNCVVNRTEVLKYPKKNQKKKDYFRNRKKLKKEQSSHGENSPSKESTSKERNIELPRDMEDSADAQGESGSHSKCVAGKTGRSDCSSKGQTPSNMESVDQICENSLGMSLSVDHEELFHPVTCKICNTKVAVYDKDEVYHFFNIVTSY